MKQRMSQRNIMAVSAAVIVLIAIVAGVLIWNGRNQTYRSIKIVEMDGTVTIDREGISNLSASVNMNLVSGDYLATGKDAYVVLRLDTDKYVMLGENGAMKVNAEGDESASRTSIQLEAGSVLNEIQNPLGQDSTFDIVTPNATMSVRGTVFEVRKKEDGNISVLVYDGCVAVALDGKEPCLYQAGEYTEFTGGSSPEFVTERGDVSEAQMNGQMLERLKKIAQEGRELELALAEPSSEESSSAEETASSKESVAATQSSSHSEEPSSAKASEPSKEKKEPVQEKVTEPSVEETKESVPESEEDDSDDSDDSSHRKPKPKPVDPTDPTDPTNPTDPTEPTNPTDPTEPTNPTDPTEPTNPTDPTEPTVPDGTYTVAYCYPYIALWATDPTDNTRYSTIMDTEPNPGSEYPSVAGGSKLQKPTTATVTMTPEGWLPEKSSLVNVGWCTESGREWDYEKDVVTENLILYPIWQDQDGLKYYPYIYTSGTKTYPCNSIVEGSTPELPKS